MGYPDYSAEDQKSYAEAHIRNVSVASDHMKYASFPIY